MSEVPTEDLPGRTTPDNVDDATVEALGKLSEALETCERARGHLYTFHQLTGSSDIQLQGAVEALREAGAEVVGVAVIVDRDTGAKERIEEAGLPYRFAVSASDLGLG